MVTNPWNEQGSLAGALWKLFYWWVYCDKHGGPSELHFILPEEGQKLKAQLCIPGHHFLMTLTLHNPLSWQGYRFELVSTYAPATSVSDSAPCFQLHELCVRNGRARVDVIPFVAWRRRDCSMRVQIQIAPLLWERLCTLADREHRFPRQQIEFLLACALSNEQGEPCLYRSSFNLQAPMRKPVSKGELEACLAPDQPGAAR